MLRGLLAIALFTFAPIPPIEPIPPIGTSSCQPVLVCDNNGQNCAWYMVCK